MKFPGIQQSNLLFASLILSFCGQTTAYETEKKLTYEDTHFYANQLYTTHQHGNAKLQIAIEGNKVAINLYSPANNIVGFEHKASTPAELEQLKAAKNTLNNTPSLFEFIGTVCQLANATINLSSLEPDKHQPEHQHTHNHAHSQHSELSALYQFNCVSGEELSKIKINLFEQFNGIKQVQALWLYGSKQGIKTLNLNNHLIEIN